MAAQKNNAVGMALGVAAVLALLYVGYKLFFGTKTAQAASNGGFVGGGYGGYNPGGVSNPLQQQQPGLLQQLLNALGGKGSGGSKTSGGVPGANASSPALQSAASLKQEISNIAGFSTAANNASNPDLGGYSLSSLPPGFDGSGVDLSGYTIPQEDVQNFDFGSSSYAPSPDLGGDQSWGGPISSTDTGDYTDLSSYSIDDSGD